MRDAGRVVRDFVSVARAGFVAVSVARSMVRGVIVRGGRAGIMLAQRHAQTRRRGRCPLDGDGEHERKNDQNAGDPGWHRLKF
jgi:hypothetical protein